MSDSLCSVIQGKNALVIWTSINMVHVTVVSHHKLINSNFCQFPEDLFIPVHQKLFLVKHGARSLTSMFYLVRPSDISADFPVDFSTGIHLLVCYLFINLHVIYGNYRLLPP